MPKHTLTIHIDKAGGLKAFLDRLYAQYQDPGFLTTDPLEFVHRYTDTADQEIVGLVCALLAYGNVKQIRASVTKVLKNIEKTGLSPSQFILKNKFNKNPFPEFIHRFHTGADLQALFWLMRRSILRYGSLGAHFTTYLKPENETISEALSRYIDDLKQAYTNQFLIEHPKFESRFFLHLLNSPTDGSACKRWCMYLRWMGRKDQLDIGIWQKYGLRSDQLVMPLDTHTSRLSKQMKLTRRNAANWKMAIDVTRALKKLDLNDPIRYDFAICRMGIIEKRS